MKKQNNYDASIRINTQVKKIEVNDQGDYITIPLGDQAFVGKFYQLVETLEEKQEEREKLTKGKDFSIREEINNIEEIHKSFMDCIDNLLGAGTCQKVFPDMIPDLYMMADFLEQLIPLIQKFVDERNKKINTKYSPNRNGSL